MPTACESKRAHKHEDKATRREEKSAHAKFFGAKTETAKQQDFGAQISLHHNSILCGEFATNPF